MHCMLPENSTRSPQPGLEPGLLNPKSSALTIRPPHLLCYNTLKLCPPDPARKKENYRSKTNVPDETGYLGDVDTSSEFSESQSSEFEDDISTTLREGSILSQS